MLTQKQYNKLTLLEIEKIMQEQFSLLKKPKKVLDFSKGTVKVLWFYLVLIQYWYRMTQCNTLNVKFSNLQLNKLKSVMKNGTEVTLNLS